MTLEDLKIKADKMQSFLEQKAIDQEEGLIDRLELLQVLLAQSGNYLAEAKYLLDQRKNDSITQSLKDALAGDWSTTIIHKKIDALCREENFLVNRFDRINSSAVHQIDALRSILSYRKAQMNL
jgi:hypothetical protein